MKTLRSEEKFRGRVVRLTVDTLELPNGESADFEIVHHPGGAAVVAIDLEGRVFLLRQYFLQIPRALDEAAMIDGANPFQILTKIIIPNSVPALAAVSLFHFFFAWNDFFSPLIYLVSKPELWPLSVGLQKFNSLYGREPNLIQAGALITLILPVLVFFLAQRVFMQGVVFSGVEK